MRGPGRRRGSSLRRGPAPTPSHCHRSQLLRVSAPRVLHPGASPQGSVRGRNCEENSMSKVADASGGMFQRGIARDRPQSPMSKNSAGVSDYVGNAGRSSRAVAAVLASSEAGWRGLARNSRHRAVARRAREAVCTVSREVEFSDRCKTNRGEGVRQARFGQSRTRVWGSKMIRYRRSPIP